MQTNNLRNNMILGNRVNGKIYSIADIKNDSVVLNEMQDGVVVPEAQLTVPKTALQECFSFIEDPNPADIPNGYTVENGVLKKDGAPATVQGEIEFIDMLGTVRGLVVVTAKTRDKADGIVDVFTYDPISDTFKKAIRSADSIRLVKKTDDTIYLEEIEKAVEEVEKEDETTVKVDTIQALNLVSISYGKSIIFSNIYGTVDRVEIVDDTILVESKDVLTYDENGFRVLKAGDEVTVTVIRDGFAPSPISLPASIDSATKQADGGSLVLFAGNTMYYENLGFRSRSVTNGAVAELKGFKYLVSCDIRNGSETYVFANDEYQTKKLILKKTYDRGNIITVE